MELMAGNQRLYFCNSRPIIDSAIIIGDASIDWHAVAGASHEVVGYREGSAVCGGEVAVLRVLVGRGVDLAACKAAIERRDDGDGGWWHVEGEDAEYEKHEAHFRRLHTRNAERCRELVGDGPGGVSHAVNIPDRGIGAQVLADTLSKCGQ